VAAPKQRSGRIIAVGGGKGGVGKSVVSANLALVLADAGHRVVLVDADLGGANLHTVLGVSPPIVTLTDFIGKTNSLDELAVNTPYPNLRLISGALDDMDAANPKHQQKMRLLRHLERFETDFLILDLGAGTSFNTLDFFLLADEGLMVVQPEPTSVENAYRFLKAAFLRRLRAVEKVFGLKDLIAQARDRRNALGIRTPADLLIAIAEHDPDVGAQVNQMMEQFSPGLVLNQVRQLEGFDDRQVMADMVSASRRFFGIALRPVGMLPADDAARQAIRLRTPVIRHNPDATLSRALKMLAGRVLDMPGRWEGERAA
jgi:flagellar biosynthesis protein FlhG